MIRIRVKDYYKEYKRFEAEAIPAWQKCPDNDVKGFPGFTEKRYGLVYEWGPNPEMFEQPINIVFLSEEYKTFFMLKYS